jgi:hypothetical protein
MKEVNKWFSRNNFVSIKIFIKILNFGESFFRGLCQLYIKKLKKYMWKWGNAIERIVEGKLRNVLLLVLLKNNDNI